MLRLIRFSPLNLKRFIFPILANLTVTSFSPGKLLRNCSPRTPGILCKDRRSVSIALATSLNASFISVAFNSAILSLLLLSGFAFACCPPPSPSLEALINIFPPGVRASDILRVTTGLFKSEIFNTISPVNIKGKNKEFSE